MDTNSISHAPSDQTDDHEEAPTSITGSGGIVLPSITSKDD